MDNSSFSIRIYRDDNDDVKQITLIYTNGSIMFEFTPYDLDVISDMDTDIERAFGSFDISPSTGSCVVSWSPQSITFLSAEYASSEAGRLYIVLNEPSSSLFESFRQVLRQWHDAVTVQQ